MDDDKHEALQQTAMQMILHAGDARVWLRAAYEAITDQDFRKTREVLAKAKADITLAHKAQTQLIQDEARGTRHDASLLFNHAQDTLMTVNSEWFTANNLLGVIQVLVTRIDAIEALVRDDEV